MNRFRGGLSLAIESQSPTWTDLLVFLQQVGPTCLHVAFWWDLGITFSLLCWVLSCCHCQWGVRGRSMVGKDHWGSPVQLPTLNRTIFKTQVSSWKPSRSEMLPATGALSQCWTRLLVKKVFLVFELKFSVCGYCPSIFYGLQLLGVGLQHHFCKWFSSTYRWQ